MVMPIGNRLEENVRINIFLLAFEDTDMYNVFPKIDTALKPVLCPAVTTTAIFKIMPTQRARQTGVADGRHHRT